MTKNIIKLENPIQVALFKEVLLGQIINEGGRWHNLKPTGHFEPFLDVKVSVRKDDEVLGANFAAKKLNYNFNDSNWVNKEEVLKTLLTVASAAAKREVAKKELYFQLESIKNILKASKAPEAAVESTPETPAEPATEQAAA